MLWQYLYRWVRGIIIANLLASEFSTFCFELSGCRNICISAWCQQEGSMMNGNSVCFMHIFIQYRHRHKYYLKNINWIEFIHPWASVHFFSVRKFNHTCNAIFFVQHALRFGACNSVLCTAFVGLKERICFQLHCSVNIHTHGANSTSPWLVDDL